MANIFEIIADFARTQLLGTKKDRQEAALEFEQNAPTSQPVQSSAISRVTYDPASLVLELDFESGDTYQYYNVRQEIADGLTKASSVGTYFNAYIKGGFYPYRRLR